MLELFDLRRRYDIDDLDNRDDSLIDRLSRRAERPLARYFRAELRGLERIPDGPALYVGNHNSALLTVDTFVFFSAVNNRRGTEHVPYGLGHEYAIRLPLLHQFIVPLGAVRASHENAERLFRRGRKVLVYPGGDVDAMRPYRRRNEVIWDGRTGFMRLALRAGVPIVPLVSAGAHGTLLVIDDMRWLARALRLDRLPVRTHVWPLCLSLPWGLTVGPPLLYLPWPAKIAMEALPPMTFPRTGEAAAADDAYVTSCAEQVRLTMEGALQRLDAERAAGG